MDIPYMPLRLPTQTPMFLLLVSAVSAATFVPTLPSFRGLPTCPTSHTTLRLDNRLEKVPPPFSFQPVGVTSAPRTTDDATYDLDLLLQETDADLQLCKEELENLSLLVPSLEDLYETTIQIQEAMQQKENEYQQSIIVLQREFETSTQVVADKVKEESEMKIKAMHETLATKDEAIKQQELQYQTMLQKERQEAEARAQAFKLKEQQLADEVAQAKAKSEHNRSRESELEAQIDSLHRKLQEQMQQNEAVNFSLHRLQEEAQAKVTAAEAKVRANHETLQLSLQQVSSKEKHLTAQVKKIASLLQEMKAKVLVSPRMFGKTESPLRATVKEHNGYKTNGFQPLNGSATTSIEPPLADMLPVASNGDYLSSLSGTAGKSAPKSSFTPFSVTSKPVEHSSYLGGLANAASATPSSSYSAPTGPSTSEAVIASPGGYLSGLSGNSAITGPKQSYAPSNGSIKVVNDSGYLGKLNAAVPLQSDVTSSANSASSPSLATGTSAPATTTDYLSAMSGNVASSGPKKSYAPAGGSMKVVKESGYLGNLNAAATTPTSSSTSSNEASTASAPAAAATTRDYLSAISGTATSSGQKKSYSPVGGSMKVAKESGYLGNLNAAATTPTSSSTSSNEACTASAPAAAATTRDYLSAMSGTATSSGQKKSYSPAGGSMKVVKETGYLGNLNAAVAPLTSSSASSQKEASTASAPAAAATTKDYLSAMSGAAASSAPKKSYAPGGGSMKAIKATGYLGNLNAAVAPPTSSSASSQKEASTASAPAAAATTKDYLSAMSGAAASSAPKKSYAPGGGSMKAIKATGYLGNLNAAVAPPTSSSASSQKEASTASARAPAATTSDYLSAMSRNAASSGPKKSYAPGGGSMKAVKETGYFGNMNAAPASVAITNPPAASSNGDAPTETSEKAAASSGDYLSALSRSPYSPEVKKSYAPGGGAGMRTTSNAGYLGSLTPGNPSSKSKSSSEHTPKLITIEPKVTSTSEYLKAMSGASTAQYINAMARNSTSFTGGHMLTGGVTVTSPSFLKPSAVETKPQDVRSSTAYPPTAPATTSDYLGSMSAASKKSYAPFSGPKKSFAPGKSAMKVPKESGYLSELSSAVSSAPSYPQTPATPTSVRTENHVSSESSKAEPVKEKPVEADTSLASSVASLYSTMPAKPIKEVEADAKPGWLKDATSPIKSYLSSLRK